MENSQLYNSWMVLVYSIRVAAASFGRLSELFILEHEQQHWKRQLQVGKRNHCR